MRPVDEPVGPVWAVPDLPDPYPAMLRFLWLCLAEDGLLALDLDGEQWDARPSTDPIARHLARYSPAWAGRAADVIGGLVVDAADGLHAAAEYPDDPSRQAAAAVHGTVLRRLVGLYDTHPDYDPRWTL